VFVKSIAVFSTLIYSSSSCALNSLSLQQLRSEKKTSQNLFTTSFEWTPTSCFKQDKTLKNIFERGEYLLVYFTFVII